MDNKSKKILFIEEDKVVQTAFHYLMKDNFQYFHYDISSTINDAKKQINTLDYDLIICDYLFSDGTGFDILKLKLSIPIVFVIPFGNEDIASKAIKMGAIDYFIKDKSLNYFKKIPQILDNLDSLKKINERNELLSYIIEQSPSIVVITDAQMKVEFVNPKFTSVTGFLPSEIIGNGFESIKSGLTPESVYFELKSNLKLGKEWHGNLINKRKNGETYWEHVHISPIFNNLGKIIRFIKISEDITNEMLVEKKLQESEELYRLIAENSTDMISKHTIDGYYTYVSPICKQILGYEPNEMIGKSAYSFFHPNDVPSIQNTHNKVLNEPIISTTTYQIRKKDGNYTWFETTSKSLINTETKQISEIIAISRDISERIKNEKILKDMMEELSIVNEIFEERIKSSVIEIRQKDQMMLHQSKQAALGEMLENIAHQWKQPLNQIGMLIQSLLLIEKDGKISLDETQQVVSESMRIIQFMAQTIDDFKNFFKPNKEKIKFNLKELVQRTILIVSVSLKTKNISVQLESEENLFVCGYPNEFAQVLLNLFNNSKDILLEKNIKNPSIHLDIKKNIQTNEIILTFTDNGGGIPSSLLNRIFEPYFTTKKEGTGLGLYMSKMIIEKSMNGKMSVKNNDLGAEFQIIL